MKLHCPCGAIIHDWTDAEPFKAWLVGDQALMEFLEAHPTDRESSVKAYARAFLSLHSDMFQCEECGRIFIQQPGEGPGRPYFCFVPENDGVPKEMFRSRARPGGAEG